MSLRTPCKSRRSSSKSNSGNIKHLTPDRTLLSLQNANRDEATVSLLQSTMETKDTPTRFPALSADVFTASDSPTAESPPVSPRTQLPAYGDEREPPKYQEDGLSKDEDAINKAKTRRTLFVRLLSSIFVTVIVLLVVAAAVGRIYDRQAREKKSKEEQKAGDTGMGVKIQEGNDTLLVSLTATSAALVFTVAASAVSSIA